MFTHRWWIFFKKARFTENFSKKWSQKSKKRQKKLEKWCEVDENGGVVLMGFLGHLKVRNFANR